ncbi:MAG: hypothetical protein WHV44_03605 [Anaerolineales bacterium]
MPTYLSTFDGLLWLVLMLLPLYLLQRLLHHEIQAIFLITTRHEAASMFLFALVFLPGVLLHELSHFVTARLLRVRTGRFSLLPRMLSNGRLRLGYVETASTDVLRDSLIGAAPLLAGGLFVSFAATGPLQLLPLWDVLRAGQWPLVWVGLSMLPSLPDFWLWFYLTFVVSSTMLPSESDRHAWLPLLLWIVVLLALAVASGIGPWMLDNLAPHVNAFLRSVAVLFGLSAAVHAALALPVMLLRRILARLTGVDVA